MIVNWAEGKRSMKELIEKRVSVTEHSFVYELTETISRGRIQFFEGVNISNNSCIEGLPNKAIVEIPAIVGPFGFMGLSVGRLPKSVEAILQQSKE